MKGNTLSSNQCTIPYLQITLSFYTDDYWQGQIPVSSPHSSPLALPPGMAAICRLANKHALVKPVQVIAVSATCSAGTVYWSAGSIPLAGRPCTCSQPFLLYHGLPPLCHGFTEGWGESRVEGIWRGGWYYGKPLSHLVGLFPKF